jgi:hypothetical protein
MNTGKRIHSSTSRGASTFRRKAGGMLILLALLATASVPPSRGDEQVDAVLDRVRAAIGYENMQAWRRGIMFEGSGLALGLECRFQSLVLPDGRFRNEMDSELGMVMGYDGRKGWMVDFSGMPGHLESVALEVVKIRNWILGGFWLDPACPLDVALEPPGENGSNHRLVLRIPGGHVRSTLEIDGSSALPARLTWRTLQDLNRMEFERFREVPTGNASFLFPHLLRIHEEGQLSLIKIERVFEAPESAAATCRPVTARPMDTRFDSQKPASVALKRLPSGHLAVHPEVDGWDVGWFLLDTGAGMNVIDKATADKLGMKAVGDYKAVGIGGLVDIRFRIGKSIYLGPVEIQKPYFVEIDLESISRSLGIKLGGLFGTDLLHRCLADLDIAGRKLFLHPPGTWDERQEDWQEVTFYNNSPSLTGTLSNGRKGLFLMDTGAGGATVAFNESFISKQELFEDRKVGKGSSGGAGGRITTYSGRIPWFEFCGRRIDKLSVSLMVSENGVSELEASGGLIGNRILSRFRMLIDYPNKRLALLDRVEE